MQDIKNCETLFKKWESFHNLPGLPIERIHRFKAYQCIESNELEAIYRLVNSHALQLRRNSIQYYDKNSNMNVATSIRDKLSLKCTSPNDGISEMLQMIEEMPKEWTIVQLTPQFDGFENINIDNEKFNTNPIHLSVFNCGLKGSLPFLVTVDTPKDKVAGKKVDLSGEMFSIISGNKEALMFNSGVKLFRNLNEKKEYINRRQEIECRLVSVIKDIQNMWLKEWRCLLSGKYVDEKLEVKLRQKINEFFKETTTDIKLSQKSLDMLLFVAKGTPYLKANEIKSAVQYCLGEGVDKDLIKNAVTFLTSLCEKFSLNVQKKHPLILVLADELDCIPWEMIDILEEEPVTRVPSLHFVYSLFKTHENQIVNGQKIIKKYNKGAYIINPDKDLQDMEARILQFLNYWLPEWTGISGYKPSEEEFFELLTTSEVFSYNGHGSGAHLVASRQIYESCIKAVVLLFGCGSTKISRLGPQINMTSAYHMYLTARSPCVVGMLWEVTDIDTDILTTEFMSLWLPSEVPIHWTNVDKTKWKKAEKINFIMDKVTSSANTHKNEPELLRALVAAKKCSKYKGTKAACVARGLPVKIVQT